MIVVHISSGFGEWARRNDPYACYIAKALTYFTMVVDPITGEETVEDARVDNGVVWFMKNLYSTSPELTSKIINYDNGGEPQDFTIEFDEEQMVARVRGEQVESAPVSQIGLL